MSDQREFHIGDRIEWVGEDPAPRKGRPRPREHGTIVFLNPQDDIIDWDEAGTIAMSLHEMPVRIATEDPSA